MWMRKAIVRETELNRFPLLLICRGINLKPEHSPLRRGDGIQTWMSMEIDFPEGYEDHSGSESENDSDSSNSSSRSRPVKGREFNVGVKSVIEISALTSTFDEPLLFLQGIMDELIRTENFA